MRKTIGIVAVLAFVLFAVFHKDKPAETTQTVDAAPAYDPVKAAEDSAQKSRVQAAGLLAYTIKQSMRDPDSLVFESLDANDAATIVCAAYRARNGFGGMNREIMVLANGKASKAAAVWNKNCTQSGMHDMMGVAKFAQAYKG